MNCFAARQGSADSQVYGGKDSLHGAEMKALLLGQLYVGPIMACCHYSASNVLFSVVLFCGFAGMHLKKIMFCLPHQDLLAKIDCHRLCLLK